MSYSKIISIHGVPRSGTSWLGQIIDSCPDVRYKYQPLFSYAFKDRLWVRSSDEEIERFFRELYEHSDDFLDQKEQVRHGSYPRFYQKQENPTFLALKEVRYHYLMPRLLQSQEGIKIVAIVRNPCGVLNSWKNAPKEFLHNWDFNEEWRFAQSKNQFRPEEYFGFHKWIEYTKMVMELEKTYPERCKLVRYEELVMDPEKSSRNIFSFCGLDWSQQTEKFLQISTSVTVADTYSVFREKKDVDDWRASLPDKVVQAVYNELKNTEFEKFLN
ncbi:sulfotransferase [Paenibacillus chartarius]|uniref:Sulfotransferase n=1 Tax=Paenibacillus chartarius TaxID=747481 RepID=A0ABV6DEY7_9BACL